MIGSHKNSISKNRISRIRLIATDVDGTLLGDGGHDLDPGYYDMIRRLARRGIIFCVCSGRQYYSIRQLFDPVAKHVYFIAGRFEEFGVLRELERMFGSED